MKFNPTQTQEEKALLIPHAALTLSGLSPDKPLELHVMDHALAVIPNRMNAMELIQAVDGLWQLTDTLIETLFQACGDCEGCERECGSTCGEEFTLSDDLREAAGIPGGAKLCAEPDRENHTILFSEAGYDYDLRDVPPDLLELLKDAGVCIGTLDDLLMEGAIIYGA